MSTNDIANEHAKRVLQQKSENQRALLMLLDDLREKEGHITALRTHMGGNNSYVCSVPLSWVAEKVHFAGDLPIFKDKDKVDDQSKAIDVDETTIAYIPQRKPDWSRQLPMAAYLALGSHHKFPPLLIVAYQNWAYDEDANEWSSSGIALQDSVTASPLDTKGHYVDLDVENTSFYALDGQHRLMAILGLRDLLNGPLCAKRKDGTPYPKNCINSDDVENWYKENSDNPQSAYNKYRNIMNERIGLEILPAVMEGENYRDAHFRLRNIFVYVNENARKLKRSELAQLDEDHGFRIVARRLMVSHPLFQTTVEGKPKIRVNMESGQLSEKSNDYTTLETLVYIAQSYLQQKEGYAKWDNRILDRNDLGYVRPSGEEIESGISLLTNYFDQLAKLESHHSMIQGEKPENIRSRDGQDHILFRPITQIALAEAIGALERDDGASIEDLAEKLKRKEGESGVGFKLSDPASPWFGILYDPANQKMRNNKSDRDLCVLMFRYLLGSGISDGQERESLRRKFFDARCVAMGENGGKDSVYNLDGELVQMDSYDANFKLPDPWQ